MDTTCFNRPTICRSEGLAPTCPKYIYIYLDIKFGASLEDSSQGDRPHAPERAMGARGKSHPDASGACACAIWLYK